MNKILFVRKYYVLAFALFTGFLVCSTQKLQAENVKECIRFYYASDAFVPSDFTSLDSLFEVHKSDKLLAANVRASCDDVGDEHYNKRLSAKRARTLCDSLLARYKLSAKFEALGEMALESADTLNERASHRMSEVCLVFELAEPESAPMVLKVGEKLTLRNLLFIPGHNDLRPGSKPTLDSLAAALKQNPSLKIHIIGHVCCTPAGKDGLDLETGIENLSVARAQRVYDLLILSGIAKERLSYEGKGGNEPLGLDDNLDRRVEVEVRD
ncbi:MAG: hypothetical protein EP332_08000 [Bacteroidetes bacterium]|nr:MAG: hypothetical protein EP332_08000 [Bacteroidota bacterium]